MSKRVSQKYSDGETSTPAKRGRPSTKEAIKETVKKAAKRYITSDEESSGSSPPPPPKKNPNHQNKLFPMMRYLIRKKESII